MRRQIQQHQNGQDGRSTEEGVSEVVAAEALLRGFEDAAAGWWVRVGLSTCIAQACYFQEWFL